MIMLSSQYAKVFKIGKPETFYPPINPIGKQAKTKEQAYFIPKQYRDPFEKGTKLFFISGITFSGHRSGTNSNGRR